MGLLDDLNSLLDEGKKAIDDALDSEALERARVEFLGRKGKLKQLAGQISQVASEEKKAVGKKINEIKTTFSQLFDEAQSGTETKSRGPLLDPTLPGTSQPRGARHPLTQTMERFATIFERLGFSIADGPEMEDEFHNFEALNIPPDHPARDDQDTFMLSDDRILRSQTSTVQIRVMESHPPPVRVIAPGRTYRPDTVDATHHYSFSQIEGLAVDEGISFADLKGTLDLFAKEMFGADTKVRFRPSFFPFTEPSAEFDISCIFCEGKGCRVCKNAGWVELGGCGMVDPNVFEAVGYDAEKYTGYAFGFGIERLAMFTLGVDDIRRFVENDLRFLRQF